MFQVSNNGIITLVRGDSFTTNLYINIGTILNPVLYQLVEGDRLYFGVMEPGQIFEDAIIKKTFTYLDYDTQNHCVHLHFKSTDTEFVTPGTYYYAAKLVRPVTTTTGSTYNDTEHQVDTIIPKTKFFIVE